MRMWYLLVASFLLAAVTQAKDPPGLQQLLAQYYRDIPPVLQEIKNVNPSGKRMLAPGQPLQPSDLFNAVKRFNRQWHTRAALLAFFYADNDLIACLVDQRKEVVTTITTIPLDSLLRVELAFRNAIGTDLGLPVDRKEDTRGVSLRTKYKQVDSLQYRRLSRLLIGEAIAKALGSFDHLIIAPVYNLYSFPFSLLRSFDDDRYLVQQLAIQVIPNLYEFTTERNETIHPSFFDKLNQVTIVGNPFFINEHRNLFYGSRDTTDPFSFTTLPYTLAQSITIEKLLRPFHSGLQENPCFLQDKMCSKPRTMECVSNSDIIYFATHGVSSVHDPWDSSFLVFSKLPGQQNPMENLWTSREILQHSFKARLAVLSACNTGTGQLRKYGILSLATSFYYAGAERVISTLWSVSDMHTYEIMSRFMEHLSKTKNEHPAKSLQQVVVGYINKSPRYWAPFILYGI